MEILEFETLPSTQTFLIDSLKNNSLQAPILVLAKRQTKGVGSRANSWEEVEEGLYFSCALPLENLPKDLPLESVSLYFGYLFKEGLEELGSKLWLKWPNDLYLEDKKIGGVLCSKIGKVIIVGIGLNLKVAQNSFGMLDIRVSKGEILKKFIKRIEKTLSWKQIFSKYRLEFFKSLNFGFHIDNKKLSLENAILCEDGSILSNGKRYYSLR
ncbi:biotin--[acetyl-CoA-carboxylase] ligase [Helicobacter valdiviensis]|uniref:Biotin--[acetyl-CoA-carboxylase] ligase n=1 Tax=Helicobacter valdiviensis TaxID=1458358 RepID=A0A2W6MT08_9HELI|nr:biotin--[acetyl-CoA-carboxylase] ligase [Helicobacter valdiviensis]PZT47684.1 biotin--[acetyl-CoA-carboxylase] ligase [Helicobacter valdiviensis]